MIAVQSPILNATNAYGLFMYSRNSTPARKKNREFRDILHESFVSLNQKLTLKLTLRLLT